MARSCDAPGAGFGRALNAPARAVATFEPPSTAEEAWIATPRRRDHHDEDIVRSERLATRERGGRP